MQRVLWSVPSLAAARRATMMAARGATVTSQLLHRGSSALLVRPVHLTTTTIMTPTMTRIAAVPRSPTSLETRYACVQSQANVATPRSPLSLARSQHRAFGSLGFSAGSGKPDLHQQSKQNSNKRASGPSGRVLVVIAGTGLVCYSFFCWYFWDRAPLTGRGRVIFVTKEYERKLGYAGFQAILQQHREHILPPNHEVSQQVRRVGMRIVRAAQLEDKYSWEFVVIRSNVPNAFVLPGGKVCVFTGLLPIVKTEAGLAAVLGHEVSHVVARHAAENISRGFFIQALVLFVQMSLGLAIPDVVTQLGLALPFSRVCEREADYMGLIFMARACYNPEEAVALWQRMGEALPQDAEFLSTHPASESRVQAIEGWMPEAMREREKHCMRAG